MNFLGIQLASVSAVVPASMLALLQPEFMTRNLDDRIFLPSSRMITMRRTEGSSSSNAASGLFILASTFATRFEELLNTRPLVMSAAEAAIHRCGSKASSAGYRGFVPDWGGDNTDGLVHLLAGGQ